MSATQNNQRSPVVKAIDETTPLIAGVESGPLAEPVDPGLPRDNPNEGTTEDEEEQPLPKTQIFLLCFTRVVEPIAFW